MAALGAIGVAGRASPQVSFYSPSTLGAISGGASGRSVLYAPPVFGSKLGRRVGRRVGAWWGSGGITSGNTDGEIAGTVTHDNMALAGAKVLLIYRPAGIVIASAWTDSSGNFSFSDLDNSDALAYTVLCLWTDTTRNALVFDWITPV